MKSRQGKEVENSFVNIEMWGYLKNFAKVNIVQVNWKLLNVHSTRNSTLNSFCLKCMKAKLSVLSKSCILLVLCEVCGTQRSSFALELEFCVRSVPLISIYVLIL